ncbi:MAG TPA: DUF3592 domain-containing protein [Pirellulales bacterium]
MARWTFLLGKKRGERRTGSTTAGRAALGLFAAVFFVAGVISLAFVVLKLSIPEWRANHDFVETTGRVLETRLLMNNTRLTRPEIHVAYEVDGRNLTAWSHYDVRGEFQADAQRAQTILDQFQIGDEYHCWYDPDQPENVVFARGYTWFAWLMLLIPGSFISVGGGGLIYTILTWGKSTERIAASAQHAPGLDFFLPPQNATADPYPFVPDPQDLNDSPGTVLAYRLPPGTGGWSLVATALVCLLWNGTVAIFVRMVMHSFEEGAPDWLLTVFVIPCVLIGVVFAWLLIRALRIATGIGPTLVEISANPLVPGGEYEVYMAQAGRLTIKRLDLKLVCEETTTYRQGTNTRKAIRRVYEQLLATCEQTAAGDSVSSEARATLTVPLDAMHSFKAAHNQIGWKFVVKGAAEQWPDFERSFPVVIRPRIAREDGR